jgi:hypothetical protein
MLISLHRIEIKEENNILMLSFSQRNSSRNNRKFRRGFIIKLSNELKSFKSL